MCSQIKPQLKVEKEVERETPQKPCISINDMWFPGRLLHGELFGTK